MKVIIRAAWLTSKLWRYSRGNKNVMFKSSLLPSYMHTQRIYNRTVPFPAGEWLVVYGAEFLYVMSANSQSNTYLMSSRTGKQ